MEKSRGFTIIELIVVIAIVAVLASIVITNVSAQLGKTKIARAEIDARNIEKALILFESQYGDYPISGLELPLIFFSSSAGGPGDPYLTVNGTNHYLSEFYKSDWAGYNANYFAKNGYYSVWLMYDDGELACGLFDVLDDDFNFYGRKAIVNKTDACVEEEFPFQTSPY